MLRHSQTVSQQIDAALQEAQTSKLFKILQYVEEQSFSDARRIVMTEIHPHEQEGKNWWKTDERLERAAVQVCVSYDQLAGIVKFDGPDRVGQYFLENWGEGVIRAHNILERFLVSRRSPRVIAMRILLGFANKQPLVSHLNSNNIRTRPDDLAPEFHALIT